MDGESGEKKDGLR